MVVVVVVVMVEVVEEVVAATVAVATAKEEEGGRSPPARGCALLSSFVCAPPSGGLERFADSSCERGTEMATGGAPSLPDCAGDEWAGE